MPEPAEVPLRAAAGDQRASLLGRHAAARTTYVPPPPPPPPCLCSRPAHDAAARVQQLHDRDRPRHPLGQLWRSVECVDAALRRRRHRRPQMARPQVHQWKRGRSVSAAPCRHGAAACMNRQAPPVIVPRPLVVRCRCFPNAGLVCDSLPAGFAQLQQLQTIDLSHNLIAGTVPPSWTAVGAMPALQTLHLGARRRGAAAAGRLHASVIFQAAASSFSPGRAFALTASILKISPPAPPPTPPCLLCSLQRADGRPV